jgi:hypothetical protein
MPRFLRLDDREKTDTTHIRDLDNNDNAFAGLASQSVRCLLLDACGVICKLLHKSQHHLNFAEKIKSKEYIEVPGTPSTFQDVDVWQADEEICRCFLLGCATGKIAEAIHTGMHRIHDAIDASVDCRKLSHIRRGRQMITPEIADLVAALMLEAGSILNLRLSLIIREENGVLGGSEILEAWGQIPIETINRPCESFSAWV